MEHLVLIDAHNLMYRAYWAIPRTLTTSRGELVNAVFGVGSMLLSLLSKEEPDALIFCLDEGEETFRHKEVSEYKEGRAETPQEFYDQIPLVLQCIDAFGAPRVSNPKYEADDLLCTYAKEAERCGLRVTIVSGDRDLLQLASEHTRIAVPQRGPEGFLYMGPSEVFAKYGIRPNQVTSWKGLTGDASDNLPGVHGIGPKTASKLLQEYGDLEGIYAHLSKITPKVRERLERDREKAFFCARYAALVCDTPLPIPLKECVLRDLSPERILSFFRRCEFTLLQKRFQMLLQTPYGRKVFQPLPVSAEMVAEEQMGLF